MDNKFDEQEIYKRLFNKMVDYSNSEFPITDFLNDVRDNPDKRFDKETAYKGLEKIFDTFMLYHNEAEKYKQLEKQFECPPEVRCNIIDGNFVYNEKGIGIRVEMVFENYFVGWNPLTDKTGYYDYKDYKKAFWLKEDRSE